MQDHSNEIEKLVSEFPNEASWIDFKEKYYDAGKGPDIIHDLLSMANLIHNGPRYIIFGVADGGQVVGLNEGVKIENLYSVVNAVTLTNIPQFSVYDIRIDGQLLSVWKIEDLPNKPYFLNKDYEKRGKKVRAGAIYSRNGPSNTPIDSTASEFEIAEMWRERFLLTQPPKVRAETLIRQIDRWLKSAKLEGEEPLVWYNYDFPEYTIELRYRSYEDFYEPWIERKKLKLLPRNFGGWSYRVMYFSTTLMTGVFFVPRHAMMPFPKVVSEAEYRKKNKDMIYELRADDIDYFVGAICNDESSSINEEQSLEAKLRSYDAKLREDVMVMFGTGVFEVQNPFS